MATRKSTTTTKRSTPKSAKQIHEGRVSRNIFAEAEEGAAAEPTDVSQWKAKAQGHLLKLPSGFTARVRRVGLAAFVEQGVIPNSLMAIVQQAIDSNKPPSQRQLQDMMSDPVQIVSSIELANAVVVRSVISPPIRPNPVWTERDVEEGRCTDRDIGDVIPIGSPFRDANVIYVDETDLDDRLFIMQWVVGGAGDAAPFRDELAKAVAAVQPSQDVGV